MKRLLVAVCALALLASGCGSDPELFYSSETESNFLASCADSTVPEPLALDATEAQREERRQAEHLRQLQNAVCECTISSFRQQIPYPRFADFDDELRSDLEQSLQPVSAQLLASCVRQEGLL